MNKSKYIKLSEYGKQKGIHYNTALNHFQAEKVDGIFISVIYSFSARMYGLRRSKRTTDKIIKTLEDNK